MSTATYTIADEPRPSAFAHITVSPLWPLFAVMFGGGWLAFPWFALNGFAMGSPYRRRELTLAAAGIVSPMLAVALISLAIGAVGDAWLERNIAYIHLVRFTLQVGFAYWLYVLQARTFGIYTYYGGVAKNGLFVVIIGYFVRGPVLDAAASISPLLFWGLS